MEKNSDSTKMKTLADCINTMVLKGYTEDFKVAEKGMLSLQKEVMYQPEDVHIVDFFRFEGASDPADNAILYVIETSDGTKGTLTDSYGPYADEQVTKFIEEVTDIAKKTVKQ